MGSKSHPIGVRLGFQRKWNSSWYMDFFNYAKFLHFNFNIKKFFQGFLYYYSIKTYLLTIQIIKFSYNQIFDLIFFYRLRKKKLKRTFIKKWWVIKKWKKKISKFFKKYSYNFFFKHYNLTSSFLKYIYKNFYYKYLNKVKYFLNSKNSLNFVNKNNLFYFSLYTHFLYFYNIFYIQNKILIKLFFNFYKQILFLKKNIYLKFYNFLKIFLILSPFSIKKKNIMNYFWVSNFFLFWIKKYNLFLKKNKKYFIIQKKNYIKKEFFIKKKYSILFYNSKINTNVISQIKKYLYLWTNMQHNIIFINSLSFSKFFYYISKRKKNQRMVSEKYNLLYLQRNLFTRFKYTAIFIKDFLHLTFITVLLKTPEFYVNFIGQMFKHLPKNRKQLKLLTFITKTIKIICKQRFEILGFKLQIVGCLNRRNRSKTWVFKKGNLPIQSNNTRIEYANHYGLIKRGVIGIKFWLFYKKYFKKFLRKNFLKYLFYSQNKKKFNTYF